MTTATVKPIPAPLYVGAQTCDFKPAFRDTHPEILAMVKACYDAHPDEQTPWLILADILQEHGDERERWVRSGVKMWSAAKTLKVGKRVWDYDKCRNTLKPICQTVEGWRMAGLWGCLVAHHSPTGDGTGRIMSETWADLRVPVIQRCLWFWALGFLENNPLDEADAAWQQADAAGRQADAAGRQADAAGRQAYAAGRQAYAAGRQADAAWQQADAARQQAYAAGRQADAAWQQADVWRYARSCWEKVCAPQLKLLTQFTGEKK